MATIELLDLQKFTTSLTPVTSPIIVTRTNEFDIKGLFSETIFGAVGSIDRKKTFSYINLNCKIIHPIALEVILQLNRKIEKFLSTESLFSADKNGNLIEDENGVTGINEFINLFPKIKFRGDTKQRDSYITVLNEEYKNGTLFIDRVPVIPPDLRPAFKNEETGEWSFDPLNDFYLTILRRSIIIRSSGKSGPLFDHLNYAVQLAVNHHSDFVQTKIGKKSGIIRSLLLGKRVDYSARSVITPGPNLKVDEIGIPLRIAVNLFKPFLIHVLLKTNVVNQKELEEEIVNYTGNSLSVESIERVVKAIKSGDIISQKLRDLFFTATEASMVGKVVIAKRDPVLHAESVRSFYPVLINGISIQICTLQTGGFNADFDGDQMALFLPLTNEAQQEAKKMMRSHTGNTPSLAFGLSKEMFVGLYLITKDIQSKESPIGITEEILNNAVNPYIPVIYKNKQTTMGKAIFNNCLPNNYPFIDKKMTSKDLGKLISDINLKYGEEEAKNVTSKLKDVGFKFATIIAPTISLSDTDLSLKVLKLKENIENVPIEKQIEILDDMQIEMKNHLKNSPLSDLVESGATKGWTQPTQMFTSKGIIADPEGNVLPAIKSSLAEGLKPKEYFTATMGARKGIIDRVLSTADTGYTSRQLVFLLNSVECDLYLNDCGTKKYLTLKLTNDLIPRLTGRYVIKGNNIVQFNKNDFKEGDIIHLRTPIFCKSPKICHTCYGDLLKLHKTPYVGVLAGQQIGERGTQMIMKTFHLGGGVSLSIRDILQDIVDNDPLVEK